MSEMKCHFLKGEICGQASEMAGCDVATSPKACQVCLLQSSRINHVTASLALSKVARPLPENKKYLAKLLKVNTYPDGPGTELGNLISWFFVPDGTCECADRIQKMNRWGSDKCEQNMDTIIRWLRHSAATHGIPFNEALARMLVAKAISNARKKAGNGKP